MTTSPSRRFALRLAATLLLAAACAPPAPSDPPPLAGDPLADAPWEAAFAPEEHTEEISGVLEETRVAPQGGLTFTPAAGARIELLVPRPDGLGPLTPVAETTTSADGSWRVGKAPPSAWAIRRSKPGFATTVSGVGVRMPGVLEVDPTAPHVYGFMPSAPLEARVVHAGTKQPVANARVEATSLVHFSEGTTDAAGTCRFDVPEEGAMLVLRDPRWDVLRTLVPAGAPSAELAAWPAPAFSGRVVAAEDGRAIEGAWVVGVDPPYLRARTGADGTFTLETPRIGRVAAFAAGRAWRSYEVPRAADLEVRLHRTPGVRGVVRDRDGRPVEGARLVGVVTSREGPLQRVRGPLTDAQGAFDMSWMPDPPPGIERPARIAAWHRRLGVAAATVPPSGGPVELVLSGLGDVRGTLADARGEPVPNAKVSARWTLPPIPEDEVPFTDLRLLRTAPTDAQGAFVLRGVPLDRTVTVETSVFGVKLHRDVGPDAGGAALRFELPPGAVVGGKVLDREGRPPAASFDVRARLLDVPGVQFERTVQTEADGSFRFDDVPPGRYALEARAAGWLPNGAEARSGDEAVSILAERAALVTVRLRGPGGGPAPTETFVVRADDRDAQRTMARTRVPPERSDEPVALGGLHPGKWRIRAESERHRGAVELELGDGETRTVEIALEAAAAVRVLLRDAAGAPLPGQALILDPLFSRPGVESFQARADDAGVVERVGLAPGRWRLRLRPRDHAAAETVVELPSSADVELRTPPSGGVDVRVLLADGSPAREAVVALTSAASGDAVFAWSDASDHAASQFRTDAEGSVRIRGIPAGRVRLQAAIGPRRPPPREVTVEAGRIAEVELADAPR